MLFKFFKYIDVFGEKIEKRKIHSSYERGTCSGLPKISSKLSSVFIMILIILNSYDVKVVFDEIHVAAHGKSNG